MGIKGWVRNTDDGKVELLAQGSPKMLAAFEDWCREGPSRAKVEGFLKQETDSIAFDEFFIDRSSMNA